MRNIFINLDFIYDLKKKSSFIEIHKSNITCFGIMYHDRETHDKKHYESLQITVTMTTLRGFPPSTLLLFLSRIAIHV